MSDIPFSIPTSFSLGRRLAVDERDKSYMLSALPIPDVGKAKRYWWPHGQWGDQGNFPRCVAFAWLHWTEDGPKTHKPFKAGSGFKFDPIQIYDECQKVDEWPGEDYGGTSVRAGAKVLQARGVIISYHWSFTLEDTINALLNQGPVVMGSNWYESMFNPDSDGFINVSGGIAGGHAYVLDGVDMAKEFVRIKNSWGRAWGKSGFAYIRFADLERLILEQGEVCLALEKGDAIQFGLINPKPA